MVQALDLFEGDRRFTADALDALLEQLDMRNVELARLAQVADTTVWRWLKGTTPIPHAVIRMLRLMVLMQMVKRELPDARAQV